MRGSHGEGLFAKQAIDEATDLMTSGTFALKIVVLLTSHNQEMGHLLAVNTGLSSHFPEEIIFEHMSPEHCLDVLQKNLKAQISRLRSWKIHRRQCIKR